MREHAGEHYISLQKPAFELITDRFFCQTLDFNSLPDTKMVNFIYA
tara:strand:+ start:184 stop:321 length:138 start_codon:yes stop_codon:yes gene_type:complete